MPKKKKQFNSSKIKAVMLSLIIAVVLFAFVAYLIQAIKPAPEWNDFCDERVRKVAPSTNEVVDEKSCTEQGGEWTTQEIRCITEPCPQGYCDFYSECEKEYDTARDKYNLVVFIVAIIVGLIAVSVGIMLNLPSVSSGLMLGGTFLTIYGTARYWDNLSNWLRVIILGIALVILIWLGYKKLEH